jgi:ribose transport system ATP-binding protein
MADMLAVRALSKSFGPTQALSNASLTVRAGEVHVLLGENGAGKSTLAKIVAGIYGADSGEILIDGRAVAIAGAHGARAQGIAIVFQELSLAPQLTVVDNLFLGREQGRHPLALLQRAAERAQALEILATLDLDIAPEMRVADLSVAEKQMLEIAKALLQSPRILIMDEPTSTLTEREKSFLFKTIRALKDKGVAILYVTHHLREVFEIGTRVSAMADGTVRVTEEVTADLTESHLLELLTGKTLSSEIRRSSRPAAPAVLVVEGLAAGADCHGVSIEIRPSEIVGVYGVVGCGRESLGRALVGILPIKGGRISLAGRPFAPRHPAHAIRHGVGYLPMDRKERGILGTRPIRENLTLSSLRDYTQAGVLSVARERAASLRRLTQLLVRLGSMEDRITSLSGGNQQKVLFGRSLGPNPQVLVMEDPTAGIDMGAKLDLYRLMRELAEQGTSFLLLSSDLAETLMFCDRVYTMYAGRIVEEIAAPSMDDEERVLASVLGRNAAAAAAPASIREVH